MHASHGQQTGAVGLYEVMADFARIGWGPVPNPYHDLGTDVYIQARDRRLVDLGAVVGAQAKGGPSYFEEPAHDDDGNLVGWWFRDSERHFDYWVRHGVPHLVVLHDLDTRRSHWVHVTPERVQVTGVGRKILVPIDQIVDEQHLDALLAVAATGKPSINFEGSAWTGAAPTIEANRLLRYALLAPRLVAPHANAGFATPIGPEQAVAMLIQGRTVEYHTFAEGHEAVPSIDAARTSDTWAWRFAGAIGRLVVHGDSDSFDELIGEAPTPHERVAATVLAATSHLDADDHDTAIQLLTTQLEQVDVEATDRAWMLVQRARIRAEIGLVVEARADAAEAQLSVVADAADVTASALRGIAGILLFTTAAWQQRDVEKAIIASDTLIGWWRSQTISYGLIDATEKTFNQWAADETMTIIGADNANNRLLAANLNAHVAGDHQAWRTTGSLLAQYNLVAAPPGPSTDRGTEAFDELRRSGDAKPFGLAVRQAWRSGPLDYITRSATNITASSWTHTTVGSNLLLWRHGGDVFPVAAANDAVAQCLSFLRDSTAFATRTSPNSAPQSQILDALAGLLPAADDEAHRMVVEFLLAQREPQNQVISMSLARCVDEIRPQSLTETARTRLLDAARAANYAPLAATILGVLARAGIDEARNELLTRAREGDPTALARFGAVRDLPPDAVTAIMSDSAVRVERILLEAAGHVYAHLSYDPAATLGLLCSWFPTQAEPHWALLCKFLADPLVAGEHKVGLCQVLASRARHLEQPIRDALAGAASSMVAPEDQFWGHLGRPLGGAAMVLRSALGAATESEEAAAIAQLLIGTAHDRRDAISMLCRRNRPEDAIGIVSLLGDPNARVRADAAGALAHWLSEGHTAELTLSALNIAVADPGVLVPLAIATNLNPEAGAARDLAEQLRSHPSAVVRERIASEPLVVSDPDVID